MNPKSGLRVFTAFATAALLALPMAAGAESQRVTIVHFNDLDRMGEDDGRGGVARLAAVINGERDMGGVVLATFGGDTISPSLMSGIDEGAHMIDLLNGLGLTAMVLGNHEYDFGPDITRQRISEAEFPVLGANSIGPDGTIIEGALPSIMVEAGDFSIGILGLTTVGTLVKSSPGEIDILDPVGVAAAEAERLRGEGADLVIALTHTDIEEDRALIANRDMDILLSGDDHLLAAEYDGKLLFAESGEQAEWVTVVDLVLDKVMKDDQEKTVWSAEYRIVDTAHVTPDAALAEAVAAYEAQLSEDLDVQVGVTATALDTRRSTVRGMEAAFGNLVADAIREATGADLGVMNGGGIRADRLYDPGTMLSRRDIISELPFGNKTVVLEITGQDFIDMMENSVSQLEKGAGRFLHLSGASARFDPSAEPGSRVLAVMVNGEAIDPSQTFTLAVNDYLAGGGDGFSMLKDKKRIVDEYASVLMTVQLFDYMEARGEVAPMVEGRLEAAK
ncbi:MAG: bifunctional UDP-sugar hydrolase/5'-nucleotidase [Rhodobacteraceae bacterium]|nr:bifunctional UDP-sugar hydrolase/5'-nucleotidase [Paracoccaceae bacterium]